MSGGLDALYLVLGYFHKIFPSWLKDLQAGDWPTLLATLLAAMAVSATLFTLSRQISQDRERNLFQRRQQASKVVAWISQNELLSPRGESAFGSGARIDLLHVYNASGVPVFQASVHLVSNAGDSQEVWNSDVLAPLEQPYTQNISRELVSLARYAMVLYFTDANGVRWCRSSSDYILREFSV